jgi:hypothetical protein
MVASRLAAARDVQELAEMLRYQKLSVTIHGDGAAKPIFNRCVSLARPQSEQVTFLGKSPARKLLQPGRYFASARPTRMSGMTSTKGMCQYLAAKMPTGS